MLHNILLKANEWNSISKQGKFINIVLASSDVTIRVRDINGAVMETQIVSGMSFPFPSGFVDVSFTSETSQQLKVWLGDNPLNYAPLEAKAVGSSFLFSSVSAVGFGHPKLIMNERLGRKKVTFNPSKDMFIGSSLSTLKTAIPIKAHENFEMETQAAIFAYSNDKEDEVRDVADLSKGVDYKLGVFYSNENINKGVIHYLPKIDRYLESSGGYLTLRPLDNNEYIPHICSVGGHTFGVYDNDDVVFFNGTNLHIINSDDGTKRDVNGFFVLTPLAIAVNKTNGNIFAFNPASTNTQSGSELVPVSNVNNPLSSTTDPYIVSVLYLPDGRLFLATVNFYCTSDDDGVTWSIVKELPSPYGTVTGCSFAVDALTGYIYYGDESGALFRSVNRGDSFEYLKSAELDWTGLPRLECIYSVGGLVVIANGAGICYFSESAEWQSIIFDIFQQGCGGVVISPDGILTQHNKDSFHFAARGQTVVGGIDVRILEESN